MLEVDRLSVSYGSSAALRGVSLAVGEGEIVVLLGSNGAGKSTLFRTLSGLVRPSAGAIRFAGRELAALPAHAVVRLGLAHAPEGKHLFPSLSVRKNLLLGAYVHRRDARKTEELLEGAFALFPALREKHDAPAGSLSGGQQQMVAIGRALMARPRLLILDEPSLGLAPRVTEEVMNAVAEIRRRGTAVLLAEQNAYAALRIADRGYVIENGSMALEGDREALLGNPEIRRVYLGL